MPTTRTVALAGNPNSGKTTVFNALTGLRQKVANYPGVTVEKKTGRVVLPGIGKVDLLDLPGTYSLISRSPDERVASDVLRGLRPDTPAPDAVIAVVDASNLARNLYLVSQLIELGRPMVVALTMTDVAARRGLRVSAEQLSVALGVPVVAVVGHRREGIDALRNAVAEAKVAALPAWDHPPAMRDALVTLGGGLERMEGWRGGVGGGRAVAHWRPRAGFGGLAGASAGEADGRERRAAVGRGGGGSGAGGYRGALSLDRRGGGGGGGAGVL